MSEVKEAPAWAVVDKDGNYNPGSDIRSAPKYASLVLSERDYLYPNRAPHRVIRVRITPLPDTEEQK